MLEGKTAIITGAAQGLGKAIAEKLAAEGAKVMLVDLNQEKLDATAGGIRDCGATVETYVADVTNLEAVEKLVEHTVDVFDKIDILINNAGITRDNLLLRMSEQEWDDVIRVNLKSVFVMTSIVGRVMLRQRSGSVVNVGSISGIFGNIGQANYAASKAGIIGLSKTSAREMAKRGIRVNVVAPGFIDSAMTAVLSDKVKQKALDVIPMRKFGQAQDVADVVCFLASDMAGYVTGEIIKIDGGMAM